jgi:hypothetical protein
MCTGASHLRPAACVLASAPCLSSTPSTPRWPPRTATCRAARPRWSAWSTGAPMSSKARTIRESPRLAACHLTQPPLEPRVTRPRARHSLQNSVSHGRARIRARDVGLEQQVETSHSRLLRGSTWAVRCCAAGVCAGQHLSVVRCAAVRALRNQAQELERGEEGQVARGGMRNQVKRRFAGYRILPAHVGPDASKRERDCNPLLIGLSHRFSIPACHRAPHLPGSVLAVSTRAT